MTETELKRLHDLLEDHPTCKLVHSVDETGGGYLVTVPGGFIAPWAALKILEGEL